MARKMKDSGIEWIGEIPEGWEVIRLKYLADFEPTCDTSYLTDESKVTYTPMECVKNGGFENRSALYGNLSHTLTPFQNGDIAMAKVTPCFENGNIAIMDNLFSGFGLGSSELFIFRPKSISTRYLFYWLQNKAFVARACSTMTGTGGLKRISPSFIRNCPVHCPSMDEQTKISDYLKVKCSEIDIMLFKTRSSIEEYKKLKQAVITQAVTKGVRGEREMKDSGIEWIGEIPAAWVVAKAKYCVTITHGSDPKTEGSIPVYGSGAESFKTCGEYKEGPAVLIGRKGATLHIPHYIEGKYWNVDTAFDVKAKNNFSLPYYYYLATSFDYKFYISQTTLPGMTQGNYYNMFLPFPAFPEQEEIVDYLDAKCAEIDKLIAKKEQLVKELESYKKSLIYEVVTGKREV